MVCRGDQLEELVRSGGGSGDGMAGAPWKIIPVLCLMLVMSSALQKITKAPQKDLRPGYQSFWRGASDSAWYIVIWMLFGKLVLKRGEHGSHKYMLNRYGFSSARALRTYVVSDVLSCVALLVRWEICCCVCLLSVWDQLIIFFLFSFLCLIWHVIKRYGWEPSTVQRWASNSQYWWSYGTLNF